MIGFLIGLVVLLMVGLVVSMWMTNVYRSWWLDEVEKRRAAESSAWRRSSLDVPPPLRYRQKS